jgi:uncharacterized protein involved in exopolysaccharide biosynthesis
MEELTLADYLVILKRWKKNFLVVFLVLLAVSAISALTWSNYRSTAMVEVDQPEVAPSMTSPTGMNSSDMSTSLADLRISKIEQKITAPSSLIDIITKFNLYAKTREYEPISLVAKSMADKIKLNLISSVIANPAATAKVSVDQLSAIAFTLSFDYNDPQIAREINSELITRFLDEDLKERRQDAVATSDFLDGQIKALEDSLAEQEQKIAKFTDENGISGPQALMFNQQAAASAMMTMQSLDAQIATNEGSQGSLRAQLASVDPYTRVLADGQLLTTPATQLKALEAQYTTLTSQYGPEHPDVVKLRNQISALKAEAGNGNAVDTAALKVKIKDVSTNLAAAEKTYGPDNPDVKSLMSQLTSLNNQLAAAPKHHTAPSNGMKQDADNPAYLALISQLNALGEQHKSLLEQRTALAQQQAKYEAAISKNPELEQEMAVLSRDHDNAEQRHRELKERKMAADMEVKMIEDHKSQRLSVISPPDLPIHTHPQGFIIFMGGFLLSIIGGLASVILTQLFSQSIIGARHLTALIGTAPLVIIPHIYTPEERDRASHRRTVIVLRSVFNLFRKTPQGSIQNQRESING